MREQCLMFEEKYNIEEDLTSADYEAFEANLKKIENDWDFKDPDMDADDPENESSWERIQRTMEESGWTWGSGLDKPARTPTVAELKACVHNLFSHALEHGHPVSGCGTGGFNVETDIYNHRVKVTFEVEGATADDQEEGVWC